MARREVSPRTVDGPLIPDIGSFAPFSHDAQVSPPQIPEPRVALLMLVGCALGGPARPEAVGPFVTVNRSRGKQL